jgi:hypothetical protein
MSVRVCHLGVTDNVPKFTTYDEDASYYTNSGTLTITDGNSEPLISFAAGRWLEVKKDAEETKEEDDE